MALWYAAGETPHELDFSGLDAEGQMWTDLENNAEGREALGLTEAPAQPDVPDGKMLEWQVPNWVLVDGPAPTPPSLAVSQYEFLMLFTTAERVAIRQAATQEPALADWLDLLNRVDLVHLDDAQTIDAVTVLTQAGLLAAGRQAEVLANQPPLA